MNTILILTFLFATKGAFLLWFGRTAWAYWTGGRELIRAIDPMTIVMDLLITAAGWAWVLGSGIA